VLRPRTKSGPGGLVQLDREDNDTFLLHPSLLLPYESGTNPDIICTESVHENRASCEAEQAQATPRSYKTIDAHKLQGRNKIGASEPHFTTLEHQARVTETSQANYKTG